MKNRHKNKCLYCKCLYHPCKYNWDRQGYCLKEECQLVRKKRNQQKWLSKKENKNFFKGSENVQRVREWRKKNPGYWRRRKKKNALQDFAFSQNVDIKGDIDIVKSKQKHALQDFANSQLFLITGLISHLTGDALQDSVVKNMRHFIFKGQSLLDPKKEMKGACHEEKVTSSRPTAEISATI